MAKSNGNATKGGKSTRHAKITGDFAEGLVLYWLSCYGYECARVDHTGIDLIARDPSTSERMGISVKSRSRYEGTEKGSVNLPMDGFQKAKDACDAFGCVPYYAIVVDGGRVIRCHLVSLEHLGEVAGKSQVRPMWYWGMSDRHLAKYREDRAVRRFELQVDTCNWGPRLSSPRSSSQQRARKPD
jgi:hypothetical protein